MQYSNRMINSTSHTNQRLYLSVFLQRTWNGLDTIYLAVPCLQDNEGGRVINIDLQNLQENLRNLYNIQTVD